MLPISSCSINLLYILLIIVQLPYTCGFRSRRWHRSSDDSMEDPSPVPNPSRMVTPPCPVLCDAQWKSDFQLSFRKFYEHEFYDIPLDQVILGSQASLDTFCDITQQKFQCLTRECETENIEWSAERHICQDQYQHFKSNHKCLSKTNRLVQRECSEICNNISARLSYKEKEYIQSLQLGNKAYDDFNTKNDHCNFVACNQICHEQVIQSECSPSERDAALHVVRGYYESYLLEDWKEMKQENMEKLYSSFCRRVTTGLNENELVANSTRFNNQILERIKFQIKDVLSTKR